MKKRIWIKRKDRVKQRYWKNYGAQWRHDPYDKKLKFKLKLIDPNDIELREVEQSRESIENIKQSGEIRKPIHVIGKYDPSQKYQVYQGHHRTIAAQERGDKIIPASISDNPFWRKKWREEKGLPN